MRVQCAAAGSLHFDTLPCSVQLLLHVNLFKVWSLLVLSRAVCAAHTALFG